MRFKIDENLPVELVAVLTDAGYDTDTVMNEGLQGADDPEVLSRASAGGRILLTLDKGIGDIRQYPPGRYAGIVLLRPGGSGRSTTIGFVRERLGDLLRLDIEGRLVVVTTTSIRTR